MEFEIFYDPCYFDMFAVRPKETKNFNSTLHFSSEKQAKHAVQTINEWFESAKKGEPSA